MEEEEAKHSGSPFRQEEPPPPGSKAPVLKASGLAGGRKRRRGGRKRRRGGWKKKVEGEAGDLAGEGSSMKDAFKKDSGLGSIEVEIAAGSEGDKSDVLNMFEKNDVLKASEVGDLPVTSPGMGDSGNAMLGLPGGRAQNSVQEKAGDSAGVRSTLSELAGSNEEADEEAEGKNAKGKSAEERFHVLGGDGLPVRSYSVRGFGQILQLSQWSLRHRITVCRVLQNPVNLKIMSPLCRHAYAQQSMKLIRKELKDIGEESSESSVHHQILVNSTTEEKLQAEVEKLVFKDWKQLRMDLEVELERVRGSVDKVLEEKLQRLREDSRENWYTTTSFKSEDPFHSRDIYLAVENGKAVEMKGREHWASVRLQEYQGATPWHWAALHLKHFPQYMGLFLRDHNDLRDDVKVNVGACDNFGFTIVHMATFASSWIPYVQRDLTLVEHFKDYMRLIEHGCLHLCVHEDENKETENDDENKETENDDENKETENDDENKDTENDDENKDTENDDENKDTQPSLASNQTTLERVFYPHDENIGTQNDDNTYRASIGKTRKKLLKRECKVFSFFIFKRSDHRASPNDEEERSTAAYHFLRPNPHYGIKNHLISPIHFLHLAVGIGHPDVVYMLIMKLSRGDGARNDVLDVRNNCGDSILHLAAWGMDPDLEYDYDARQRVMVTLLRNLHYYPILLNSSNSDGQRPLDIATFQGSRECVKALLRFFLEGDAGKEKDFKALEMAKEWNDKSVKRSRNYMKMLGIKSTIDEKYGFSTYKYNDAKNRGSYEEVATLIQEWNPKLCQWKLLQSSQWSLRHRILALQIFYTEHSSTFDGTLKVQYVQQCVELLSSSSTNGTLNQNINPKGNDSLEPLAKGLRGLLEKYTDIIDEHNVGSHPHVNSYFYSDIPEWWREIFCAIEEDDWKRFNDLMRPRLVPKLNQGPKEYKGATPLHWAALYGRRDMVSFIIKEMQNFDKEKVETWLQNTSDDKFGHNPLHFGFTPLHLALFSSLRLCCTEVSKDKMRRDAKETEELIDELYQSGVLDIACNQAAFFVLNWGPKGIYVDDHLSKSNLHPMFLGVHFSHPCVVHKLLEKTAYQNFGKIIMSNGDSILHCARAWEGLIKQCSEVEWRKIETILFRHLEAIPKAVNSRNFNLETPLHIAVHTKSLKWMEILLQTEHVKFTSRDRDILTPGGRATKMLKDLSEDAAKKLEVSSKNAAKMLKGSSEDAAKMLKDPTNVDAANVLTDFRKDAKEIQNIIDLMDSFDPESVPRREKEEKQLQVEQQNTEREEMEKKEKVEEEVRKKIEALQRERQVYVDAANAILVGAALIASASFGAWLQPPLGFHPYYSPEFLDTTAPPSVGPVYESFVAIQQYWIIHLFWVFNSLSFFFSLATVMAGADAALPKPGLIGSGRESDVNKALISVKNAVKRAAWLLILSIIFVICTFATLGFTVLPPITKYRINLIVTLSVGGLVCILFLIMLVRKLVSKEKTIETPATPSS